MRFLGEPGSPVRLKLESIFVLSASTGSTMGKKINISTLKMKNTAFLLKKKNIDLNDNMVKAVSPDMLHMLFF